MGVFQVVWLGK